ncbi:hypothetical protein UT300012_24430 [Paraclostridium bifermentans]
MQLGLVLDMLELGLIVVGLTVALSISVMITLNHRKFDRHWNEIVKGKRGVK